MALRFIINYYKYRRINSLYKGYIDNIVQEDIKFIQNKEEIKSLFKEAGLKDSAVLHQEHLGFGQFTNMKISVFDNLTNRREDIVNNVQIRFNEAIGVFKKRYKDSFNPIFWIEFIIKLPQYLMEFFGVLPEKMVVKVFLIIYWVVAVLFGLKKMDILEYLIKLDEPVKVNHVGRMKVSIAN